MPQSPKLSTLSREVPESATVPRPRTVLAARRGCQINCVFAEVRNCRTVATSENVSTVGHTYTHLCTGMYRLRSFTSIQGQIIVYWPAVAVAGMCYAALRMRKIKRSSACTACSAPAEGQSPPLRMLHMVLWMLLHLGILAANQLNFCTCETSF